MPAQLCLHSTIAYDLEWVNKIHIIKNSLLGIFYYILDNLTVCCIIFCLFFVPTSHDSTISLFIWRYRLYVSPPLIFDLMLKLLK